MYVCMYVYSRLYFWFEATGLLTNLWSQSTTSMVQISSERLKEKLKFIAGS